MHNTHLRKPGEPRGTTTPRTGVCRHEHYARGPRLDPGDVIYSRVALHAGERIIATSGNRLKILFVRDGLPAGGCFFCGDELVALLDAARRAGQIGKVRSLHTLPLPSGAAIEIGAGCGRVYVRTRLPTGDHGRATVIADEELAALRRALAALGEGVRRSRADRYDAKDRLLTSPRDNKP